MSSTSVTSASQPISYFHPTHWGDKIMRYIPLDKAIQVEKEKEVEHLKEEVRKELLGRVAANVNKPLELLNFIDATERLGLAYHFEKEIEEALLQIYENYHDQCEQDDLYHVSTRFRLLRHNGYRVSCDVFKKFKNEQGGFDESILKDTRAILSLYEASYVHIHGDDILDEALAFTTTHLKLIVDKLSSPLAEQVAHALHQPLHLGFVRLESKHYIAFYEQDASHNKTLLHLAKLDFNLLQMMHREELQDIVEWWKDLYSKAPFTRDRLVEGHFWILGCYYEPKYRRARQILFKLFMIVLVFDDIFDAYGSHEILKLFDEAVQRWDYSYVAKLPEYFNSVYQVLLETLDGFEKELAEEGRSYSVQIYKEQFYRGCETWLRESGWLKNKYTPKYDDYLDASMVSIGQIQGIVGSYIGMTEPIATEQDFAWVYQDPMPKVVEASLIIIRLLNDIASTKIEQNSRDHVVSSVQCYMKETGITDEEQVIQVLEKKVEDLWKDINQGMLRPYSIPKPLLDRIINLTRAPEVFYMGRTDGFTIVNQIIQDKISSLLFEPIPI